MLGRCVLSYFLGHAKVKLKIRSGSKQSKLLFCAPLEKQMYFPLYRLYQQCRHPALEALDFYVRIELPEADNEDTTL